MKFNRRSVGSYLLYLLILLPFFTDYLETGHLPNNTREYITEVVLAIIVGIIVYITVKQRSELERLSTTDHLTGLRNRRQLETDLKQEILKAIRLNTELILVFIDLNKFKEVNDTWGHKEGDKILIELANQLIKLARQATDFGYRFGGDEFILLLTNISRNQIAQIKTSYEKRLNEKVFSQLPHNVTASIGFVVWNRRESSDDLIIKADKMMYASKQNPNSK